MITVENLLMAFASAYDAWLDPDVERKNPVPEYAALIRRVVDSENAELRELVRDMARCIRTIGEYDVFYWEPSRPGCGIDCAVNGEGCSCDGMLARARELGIEVE